MLNNDQVHAILRHVYTAVAAGSAVLVMVGMSQGDVTALGEAVHKIGDGLASVWAGVSMLIPIASGLYAAYGQRPAAHVAAVAAMPGTEVTAGGAVVKILDPSLKVTAIEHATDEHGNCL